jgi:hypothetical protein
MGEQVYGFELPPEEIVPTGRDMVAAFIEMADCVDDTAHALTTTDVETTDSAKGECVPSACACEDSGIVEGVDTMVRHSRDHLTSNSDRTSQHRPWTKTTKKERKTKRLWFKNRTGSCAGLGLRRPRGRRREHLLRFEEGDAWTHRTPNCADAGRRISN